MPITTDRSQRLRSGCPNGVHVNLCPGRSGHLEAQALLRSRNFMAIQVEGNRLDH